MVVFGHFCLVSGLLEKERKKERKNEKWAIFKYLVLACTIVLMNDLGLARCTIC